MSDVISCVATFIAPTPEAELARHIGAFADRLPGAADVRWLDEGRAADIDFSGSAGDLALLRADPFARDHGIDAVFQPQANRRKRLLLADMDSTIIGQECIDELADFVGLKPMVSAITERAMRGELAFAPALRERVALLEGLPLSVIDTVLRDRITITSGADMLVRTMRSHGATCALISGGFTLFTAPVAARVGFDENRGNVLVVENEHLAGRVEEPILGRDAKLAALRELRERLGLSHADTLAIGDGANDLGMIGDAGLGLAFHAKPAVAASAAGRIDHGDLTSVLFAQGYARQEFVAA